jgi:hypothetical protein
MSNCVSCGHELDVGRFCTNCGHPVDTAPPEPDWRDDTAVRPKVPTTPPPSAPPPPPRTAPPTAPPTPPPGSVPPKPRFPLFADEVEDAHPVPRQPSAPPDAPTYATPPAQHRARRPWVPWVAVAAALLLVAGLGVWLLTGDDDPDPTASDQGGRDRSSRSSGEPSRTPTSEAPPAAGDVTADSTVQVPETAPPNRDVEGNPVTYAADNMLDGDPETCWRMPGDAAGEELTITLPGEAELRSVGLVNGYAKTAQDADGRELDWYHGNRRVLSVEWVFDDGTTLSQDLEDSTDLQAIHVAGVTTSTITLRLVTVSEPGTGPAARNYTAISDLAVVTR